MDTRYKAIVKMKKLNDEATVPSYGSDNAAGLDLYALFDADILLIPAGETVKVGTGIALQLPDGHFGGIFARSGMATKYGLRPANCVGVIDSDYRGEIIVALHNDTGRDQVVHSGDRIAQLVVMPYLAIDLQEGDIDNTERGDGGFGSTGMSI